MRSILVVSATALILAIPVAAQNVSGLVAR
jgi:hypothetical protein